MDELAHAREKIDAIDKEMAQLFCARMDAVREVVAYKMAHGLPVLDAAREEAVVAKNLALLPDASLAEFYEDTLRHNMAVSRAFQTRLLAQDSVGYQGIEGAFSHIALTKLFPHAKAHAYASFSDVFDAVARGEIACGVLPFENSNAGDVTDTLDLCFAHPHLHVTAMVDLPVTQNLLCVPGATLADITTVLSHPQALRQSRSFLKTLGANCMEATNTAAAAKAVADGGSKHIAAVASAETAAIYGLHILAEHINEADDNATRFIVVQKEPSHAGNRFSLLFTVDHKAGKLAQVVQCIGEMGFNMESIKSRPMPKSPWEYYFYTELVGTPSEALLQRLDSVCQTVRVLGIYTR